MFIYIYILIVMNIYITKDNEKYLRTMKNESDLSMSGLINDLLYHAREVRGDVAKGPTKKEFKENLTKPEIIKTPEDAAAVIKKVFPKAELITTKPIHAA